MSLDFLTRLVELLKEDKELHDAAQNLLNAKAAALYELAAYRKAKAEALAK